MQAFFTELRRRKIWWVTGVYLAVAWVVVQVVATLENTLSLPPWMDTATVVFLIAGFPVAILLAWAQETQATDAPDAPSEVTGNDEDRPSFSIAVLPYNDLSRDDMFQEIADGVPEDIITQLSYEDALNVTARNSSFAFKGTSPDVRDVARQLNVRYVLEGSFRKVGESVRITTQLIEALTGAHVWSGRVDHPVGELDEQLDNVVDGIVIEASGVIFEQEQKRLMARDPEDLSATDLTTLASWMMGDFSVQKFQEAERLMTVALKKAPDDGMAHAVMARVEAGLPILLPGQRSDRQKRAAEHLEKAKSAGPADIQILLHMAGAALFLGQSKELAIYAEQLRKLAPKHPGTWGWSAAAYIQSGQLEECLEAAVLGRSLSPTRSPYSILYLQAEALASLGLGNFAESEARAREHLSQRADLGMKITLIAALALQGKADEAASELEQYRSVAPEGLTLKGLNAVLSQLFGESVLERQIEGLRLAGLQ